MAKYRKIVSKIWDDDKFPFLSSDAQRLFWLHLTSPASTPFLLYVEGEGAMSDRLRSEGKPMPIARVRKAQKELSERGMAWYAKDGSNLVFLPNALKQRENAPDGGNSLITWYNLFNDLPRTPFLEHCIGHLITLLSDIDHPLTREFILALDGPYPKGKAKGKVTHSEPITDGPSIQEQEQDTGTVEKEEKPTPGPAKAREPDEAFETFSRFHDEALKPARYPRDDKAGFVQLAKLRRANGVEARASPPEWEKACKNYFASPLSKYTVADICSRYPVFVRSPLNQYGKPIEGSRNGTHGAVATTQSRGPTYTPRQ